MKGGIPDYVDSARLVLRDWNTGKIPYYTAPPEPDLSVCSFLNFIKFLSFIINICE